MSILAAKHPGIIVNGKRLKNGASRFAQLQGEVATRMRADAQARTGGTDNGNARRAKLMLAAKANLHFSEDIERGKFTLIDPDQMQAAERAEAEAAGLTSRTLVLHPDDLDRAIEQFSKASESTAKAN